MMPGLVWAQVGAVATGAAVGALLRWWAALWLNKSGAGLPLGTLLVNCLGGLLIGMLMVWFERVPNEVLRLLLVTGFLGGLTTFSTFSGESLALLQRGDWGWALAHTLAHTLGSLACAALGFVAARALLHPAA
jgi:CrcB protein